MTLSMTPGPRTVQLESEKRTVLTAEHMCLLSTRAQADKKRSCITGSLDKTVKVRRHAASLGALPCLRASPAAPKLLCRARSLGRRQQLANFDLSSHRPAAAALEGELQRELACGVDLRARR